MRRLLATVLLALLTYQCAPRVAPPSPAAKPEPDSESYSSPNGLITIHYPPEFAAQIVGKSGLELARRLEGGRDEAITFVSVMTPISPILDEFARVVDKAGTDRLDRFVEISREEGTALGVPSVESIGYFFLPSGLRYKRRSWAFLREGHGYSFSYLVPERDAGEQEPILESIVRGTEFKAEGGSEVGASRPPKTKEQHPSSTFPPNPSARFLRAAASPTHGGSPPLPPGKAGENLSPRLR